MHFLSLILAVLVKFRLLPLSLRVRIRVHFAILFEFSPIPRDCVRGTAHDGTSKATVKLGWGPALNVGINFAREVWLNTGSAMLRCGHPAIAI